MTAARITKEEEQPFLTRNIHTSKTSKYHFIRKTVHQNTVFLNSGEFFSLNLPNSFFPRPPSFSPFILPNSLDRYQKDLQARRLMLDSASFPLALHRFPGSCSCLTGGKGLALPLLLLSCRADEKEQVPEGHWDTAD